MTDISQEYMRPLVDVWKRKLQAALSRRKPWKEIGDQCYTFYAGMVDAFWKQENLQRFTKGAINPTFKMSLLKGFEMVSLFGPTLFYRNPVRSVKPFKRLQWNDDQVLLSLGIDPRMMPQLQQQAQQAQQQVQQLTQQFQQQQAQQAQQMGLRPMPAQPPPQLMQAQIQAQQLQQQLQQIQQAVQTARIQDGYEKNQLAAAAEIAEEYLTFTPREQPDGGLEKHGIAACTELLITGRGLLFPRAYKHPGSGRTLTGCFYESSDRLVTDPDARTIQFGDTKWVALFHRQPYWDVERRFKLKAGSLKKYARKESTESSVNRKYIWDVEAKFNEQSYDLVEWWEIWSCGGVGTRLSGYPDRKISNEEIDQDTLAYHLDDVIGDYAYVAIIADGDCPYPLNATKEFMDQASDDQVREAFSWPIPYWLDQRWPFAELSVYADFRSPYPISPLRPAISELTLLNFVMSQLASMSWQNSRQVIGVLESARDEVENYLTGGSDIVVIPMKDIHKSLEEVISEYVPKNAMEVLWKLADALMTIIDKRTGLTEIFYSGNPGGVQSRTAADIQVKRESSQIRPDHMSKEVDAWMREAARMEKLCAYFAGVKGADVKPLLGTIGASLWDRYFASAEPDMILYEMDATVEAGTARKPNKDRDQDNITKLMQPLMPLITQQLQIGNVVPANVFLQNIVDAFDLDRGDELQIQPPPPQPGAQEQQAMMQLKQQQVQAEVQRTQTEAETAKMHAQIEAAKAQQEMRSNAQSQQIKQIQDAQAMQHDQQAHVMDLQQQQEKHGQEMLIQLARAALQQQLAKQGAAA